MNATKNELQHNTMLHYYIGTTVNGAKGIAHTVKANPLWIVAMLVMAWLAYSVQDMRATESMGSIGHLMTVLQSVEMHDVAWIPLTTGGYLLPIPGVTYKISKPLTDGTVFLYKNKKSAKSPMPLQFIFDWVYQDLRQKHANAKYIWCKSERKRWDNQPITHEQITLIKKLAPDYKINTKKTTRGDASAIIQNLLYIRQAGDKNAS